LDFKDELKSKQSAFEVSQKEMLQPEVQEIVSYVEHPSQTSFSSKLASE
jgi:hypothetical protein